MPSVNLSKKLPRDWKLNFEVESRQQFRGGTFGEASTAEGYNYILTDNTLSASKKVGFTSTLAGGYMLRFREGRRFHRTTQQITFTKSINGLRLAHRFSTDQTFATGVASEYRLRYRIGLEKPLAGESIDPGEWYINVNHEYLQAWQGGTYDLEIRLVPSLGYELTASNKVEIGLDYRINSFVTEAASHRFWGTVNWFVSF